VLNKLCTRVVRSIVTLVIYYWDYRSPLTVPIGILHVLDVSMMTDLSNYFYFFSNKP